MSSDNLIEIAVPLMFFSIALWAMANTLQGMF